MSRQLSRRRLLASTGLVLSAGAAGAAGAARPESPANDADAAADPPPVRWTETYGNESANRVSDVVAGDGEVTVLSSTVVEEVRRPWLFAVDAGTGEGLWQRPLDVGGESVSVTLSELLPVGDGYLLAGTRVDRETDAGTAAFFVRTDSEGAVQWTGTHAPDVDVSSEVQFWDVTPTGDDGFAFASFAYLDGFDNVAPFVGVVEADGTARWTRTLDDADPNEFAVSVVAEDDGYSFAGLARPPESQETGERLLFKLDSDGNQQWKTATLPAVGGSTPEQLVPFAHVATADGYFLAGSSGSPTEQSGFVELTTATGETRSTAGFASDRNGGFRDIAVRDGTYYLAGPVTRSADSEDTYRWLVAVDADANGRWETRLGRVRNANVAPVVTTDDGGIATASSVVPDGREDTQARVTKVGGDPVETPTPTPTSTPTPSPTPTETPTPSPTPSPTPTPTPTDTPTPSPTPATEEGPTTTSDDGPGFGLLAALGAFGGGALLSRWRVGEGADADE